MAYSIEIKAAAVEVAARAGLPKASEIFGASQRAIQGWCTLAGRAPKQLKVRMNLDPYAVAEYYMAHTGRDTAAHFGTTESNVGMIVSKMRKKYPRVFQYKLNNVPRIDG